MPLKKPCTYRQTHILPKGFILLLWVLIPVFSTAQFKHKLFSSNLLIEGKIHYGFLYAHHLELEMYNAHFPAFEVSLAQMTYGKAKWERDYNYPIIGITFFYSGLGYNPSLGQSYALMPFINFPLVKSRSFTFGFRFALGLGYLTRHFERLTNYKNQAIGSHFNAAVNLMFEARYRINYFLTLTGGISLQHFSNGSLKLPNYGINAPLVNVGVAYRPFKENRNIGDRYFAPVDPFAVIIRRSIEFNFGAMTGWKDMKAVLGKSYMVYHIYENTMIQISRKSKVGIGLDLSYDPSQVDILEKNGTPVDNRFSVMRPGINVAYELIMSRLGFIINLGGYLGGKEKSNGPLYEKISVQYNFSNHFFASVMLKVHWGRADYIGWGLGYKFDIFYGRKTVK